MSETESPKYEKGFVKIIGEIPDTDEPVDFDTAPWAVSISMNPSKESIARTIAKSEHKAAKWIRDPATGDVYYWAAEKAQHEEIARMLKLADYEKGIEAA